jgi:serine/threonine protein kinase
VHRDLQPKNIMVDADGHIILTGFGCAKVLGSGSDAYIQRTATLCGTKEYQAPEMHLGWVHDFSVDCWAFGILLYVMLFGRV